MNALRILIASERYSARLALKVLLENYPEWEICGEARTGGEAVSEARKLKPDIAILDIHMPGLSGRESTKRIRTVSPNTEILILSARSSDQIIQEIVAVGARGHILESDSNRDLIIAIQTVANHEPFPAGLVEQLPAGAVAPETVWSEAKASRGKKVNAVAFRPRGEQASLLIDPVCDTASSPPPSDRPGPTELESMKRELAEAIALVEQPFQDQLVRIGAGKPDDLSARDYLTEEFFAVAVRFFALDGARSEQLPRLCCEIFAHLAPPKYGTLTPNKMARLMLEVAQNFPERYTDALQATSFLCVNLLACSDETFGTKHAERVRSCLLRFANALWATSANGSPREESELRRMESLLKVRQFAKESAVVWAMPAPPELGHAEEDPKEQILTSEEILRVGEGLPASEIEPETHRVSTQTTARAPALDLLSIFSRFFSPLGKIRNWLNTPIK
jgi:DNA-binding NarL/FixJ family response regulator